MNVYPVPDGDTGSNMFATVRAARRGRGRDRGHRGAIAGAISFGALMGARGNSGVITSQVFRGMAEALGGKSRFNGLDRRTRSSRGQDAYGAVAKPVEGTILTVIREAADAAVATAEENDIEVVLAATVEAAEKSVARALAPADPARSRRRRLRRAGLFRLFQGAYQHLRGLARSRPGGGRPCRGAAAGSTLAARIDEGFGYETMFLLQAHPGGRSTSTRSGATSSRSASRSWSPATPGRSRSTSTTSALTRSSATGSASAA